MPTTQPCRARQRSRSAIATLAVSMLVVALGGCSHGVGGPGSGVGDGAGFEPGHWPEGSGDIDDPSDVAAAIGHNVMPPNRGNDPGSRPAALSVSRGMVLTEPGRYDFGGQLHRFQTLTTPVVEYTEPALQIAADGVVVENFAFAGSMEGPHIASRHPFGARQRRQPHDRIAGVMRGLVSLDIGEDALTIGPWSTLSLQESLLRGRHEPGYSYDGDLPGLDKGIQNDGGTLLAGPSVQLENFVRAYRGKANSVAVLDGVTFVNCHNPVRGDGGANPRQDWPFDRGQPGLCLIIVRNSRFINCHNPFRAGPGCVILVDRVSVEFEGVSGPLAIEEGDGRVIVTRQLDRQWARWARRMDDPSMAGLEQLSDRAKRQTRRRAGWRAGGGAGRGF